MKRIVLITLAAMAALPAAAQRFPERRMIRTGNGLYEKGDFAQAEIAYRRALEKGPESYEAADNLAKALYKQERYDEASQIFAPLAADSTHMKNAAAAYYDNGNGLFQQRKLEEALEAYKQSLRINPNDMEAKFNLAYTQKLLEKNKGGGGGGNNNQNQNQNQPQPQQGDGQQPPPDQGDQKPQPQQGQGQGQGGMSREEADRILEAMQMSEEKSRDDKDEKQGQAAKPPSGKNW